MKVNKVVSTIMKKYIYICFDIKTMNTKNVVN